MRDCDCGLCCNDEACGGHDSDCIWWEIHRRTTDELDDDEEA